MRAGPPRLRMLLLGLVAAVHFVGQALGHGDCYVAAGHEVAAEGVSMRLRQAVGEMSGVALTSGVGVTAATAVADRDGPPRERGVQPEGSGCPSCGAYGSCAAATAIGPAQKRGRSGRSTGREAPVGYGCALGG